MQKVEEMLGKEYMELLMCFIPSGKFLGIGIT